jgi:hypothetical protein
MGTIIEFAEPFYRFEFSRNKLKQKTLIDAVLHYSHLDISDIAMILEIPEKILDDVHKGLGFLENEVEADSLGRLFLVFFSD